MWTPNPTQRQIAELAALLKDASPFFDSLPIQNLRTHISRLQFLHAAEVTPE